MIDKRLEGLKAFVRDSDPTVEAELVPLSGDASFRRYFRCGPYIAVDSPPDTQKNFEFVMIDRTLAEAGVRVPKIIAFDLDNGYLLEEDLGEFSFAAATSGEHLRDRLVRYQQALRALGHLLKIRADGQLPKFNAKFIRMEFGIFTEWLLDKTLHLELSSAEQEMLEETLASLIKNSNKQPKIAMHRDFHSRNLMVVDDDIAVLDFQDMVEGPITYDAASLLFDCYVRLDEFQSDFLEKELHKLIVFYCMAKGIKYGPAFKTFDKQLRTTSLQRHLKVLGIFMRLKLRDGKDGYLKDLPRVMNYCLEESEICGFAALHDFLLHRVKPGLDEVLDGYGIDPDQED